MKILSFSFFLPRHNKIYLLLHWVMKGERSRTCVCLRPCAAVGSLIWCPGGRIYWSRCCQCYTWESAGRGRTLRSGGSWGPHSLKKKGFKKRWRVWHIHEGIHVFRHSNTKTFTFKHSKCNQLWLWRDISQSFTVRPLLSRLCLCHCHTMLR